MAVVAFRIRHGVAEDRRVSIEDKQMRHGCMGTESKRFNGYKRHLDTLLILAIAVLPAMRKLPLLDSSQTSPREA